LRRRLQPWFLTELRAEATRALNDTEKKDAEKSAVGFEEMKRNVKKLLDAGVLLAAGTDAAVSRSFSGGGHPSRIGIAGGSGDDAAAGYSNSNV